MNIKLEHDKHIDHDNWPMFLTADLREKLIQAKIARVSAMIKRQDRVENEIKDLCSGPHCECH